MSFFIKVRKFHFCSRKKTWFYDWLFSPKNIENFLVAQKKWHSLTSPNTAPTKWLEYFSSWWFQAIKKYESKFQSSPNRDQKLKKCLKRPSSLCLAKSTIGNGWFGSEPYLTRVTTIAFFPNDSLEFVESIPFCRYGWKSKNRGGIPKMDGIYNGKPYYLMDDLGGKPHYFRKHPYSSHLKLHLSF